jgi:hypothetical protein
MNNSDPSDSGAAFDGNLTGNLNVTGDTTLAGGVSVHTDSIYVDPATGFVGLGTTNPFSRYTFSGPDSDTTTGNFISIMTDADAYPLMQFMMVNHGQFIIGLDCYFNGGFKSSNVNGCFYINKIGGNIEIRGDAGIAPGAGFGGTTICTFGADNHDVTIPNNLKLSLLDLTPQVEPAAVEGRVYYDSTASKLKVYTGAAWETITSA